MSRIQTNVAANSAYRNLAVTSAALERQITKLSSGYRINRSGDDAAGMAIANKLRAESRSLQQASRNAAQGISMLQIADGAVNTVSGILDRMKELASAANSASIGTQLDKLDSEFQQLISEIGRIAATTKYQGSALVNGTLGNTVDAASTYSGQVTLTGAEAGTYTFASAGGVATLSFGAGATLRTQAVSMPAGAGTYNFDTFGITVTNSAGYAVNGVDTQTIVVTGTAVEFMVSSSGSYASDDLVTLNQVNLTTSNLGLTGLSLLSSDNAQSALSAIDSAIDKVNQAIGTIGAAQSRMEFAAANVATITQNVIAAESTIRDADMALESTSFTKYQILQQAGTAMLAQANVSAQSVLDLLR
jgi:flagellin